MSHWSDAALTDIALGGDKPRDGGQPTPIEALRELIQRGRADALKHLTGGPGLQLRCAFCGERYPAGTPDCKHELLTAHIRVCVKHPIGLENRELRDTLRDVMTKGHAIIASQRLTDRITKAISP